MRIPSPLVIPAETTFGTAVIPAGSLIVLGVAAVLTVLWVWMLVDALVRPSATWRRADRSQLVWILVLVFLGWLGALLYVVLARPSLRGATRA